jgi:hypothetical protein
MKLRNVIALLCLSYVVTGCISSKSYVDPKYGDLNYSHIKKPVEVKPANIEIEFQRNGKVFPKAEKLLRADVEKVLVASGVVTPSTDSAPIKIKVVCNNIADIKGAMSKGFGAGLTFGAKGTAVTDFYQVTIQLTQGDKVIEKQYDHALHTTIGNKEAPVKNVAPQKLNDGFSSVIEDVILEFIKEMQAQNILTLNELFKTQG